MIVEKYGIINKWESGHALGPYGVSLWKGINTLLDHFREIITMDGGNGMNTLFWEGKWCGQRPLDAVALKWLEKFQPL